MPFDGNVPHWEPEELSWGFRGCFVVVPLRGPRGGYGPYKGRWTVETTSRNGWIKVASVVAKNRRSATGLACCVMRQATWSH